MRPSDLMIAAMMTAALSGCAGDRQPETGQEGALAHCYAETVDDVMRSAVADCLAAMLAEAESDLGETLDHAANEIAEINSSSSEAALMSLRQSEADFERFRTSECRRVADAAMGASGAGDFQRACEVDLTLWRIQQLDAE